MLGLISGSRSSGQAWPAWVETLGFAGVGGKAAPVSANGFRIERWVAVVETMRIRLRQKQANAMAKALTKAGSATEDGAGISFASSAGRAHRISASDDSAASTTAPAPELEARVVRVAQNPSHVGTVLLCTDASHACMCAVPNYFSMCPCGHHGGICHMRVTSPPV